MKKFFIICAILISISLFLPFIKDISLLEMYSHASDMNLSTEWIVQTILMFIMWTWFLAIWYSKKVRISILWIIWALIYLYFYYKIFSFIWDNAWSVWNWYRYSSNYLWAQATNDVIFMLIKKAWSQLSIWFYTILIWFVLNSFAIINILKNLFKLSWNINKEKIDEFRGETENTKEKMTWKEKAKLTWIFAWLNILTLILSSFFWSFVIDLITVASRSLNLSIPLWILLSLIVLNLYLTNKYINKFIEDKKLFIYSWVWFAVLIIITLIKG